jgi:hypothetical protein
MKFSRLAGWALLPLLAVGSAHAVTEDNFQINTTGDLVALCSASPNDPLGTAALNFCHGFVVGAVRLQQVHHHASPRRQMFCLPEPTPNREQAIAEFVTWAKADAARLAMRPFDSMFTYLGNRYPCKGKK